MTYRTKTKVVCVKLTPTEIEEIHRMVSMGRCISVADAIREGLGLLFAAQGVDAKVCERMKSERRIHAPRAGKVRRLPMT